MEQILDSIAHHAARRPDAIAVVAGESRLSYAALVQQSEAAATAFARTSAATGADILAYLGTTDIDLVVSLLAAHKAGLPFVHLDANQRDAQLNDICTHAGAALVVVSEAGASRAALLNHAALLTMQQAIATDINAASRGGADELSVSHIRYTSGSTGRPKGVPLTRRHVARMTAVFDKLLVACERDVYGLFGHFWPLVMFRALSVGARLECFDFARRGAGELSVWMRERRITAMFTYPSVFRKLADATAERLPELRFVHVSGEPIYGEDVAEFERLSAADAVLHNSFGSSEYPWIAAWFFRHGDPVPAGLVPLGTPVFPEELRLVAATGERVRTGDPGEIVITSGEVPRAYHNDPERTSGVFAPDPDDPEKTRYYTGDLARFDRAGVLQLLGRKDDQVKVRGFVVRPAEIESELALLPALREAAIVALQGPQRENRLACHYVSATFTPREIRTALAAVLPDYMVPTEFVAHASLPRTRTGKIDRAALVQLHAERAQRAMERGASNAAVAPPVYAQLARIWSRALGHSRFGDDDDFFAVGGDSLQAMSVLLDIERVFGVRIPNEALQLQGSTLRVLAELIEGAPAAPAGGLVRLRYGHGESLLLAPLIGGQFAAYLPFVDALPGHYPVLGLQPLGLARNQLAAATVGALAAHAVATLRDSGLSPPWRVAGYSFGATVALEIARQLQEAGQGELATLILIDPPPDWNRLSKLARFVYAPLKDRNWELAKRRCTALPVAAGLQAPAQADAAHMAAWLRYRPQPLHLDAALLVLSVRNIWRGSIQRDWRRLLRGDVHETDADGDHLAMMDPPHVGAVARRVEDWLRQL